MRRDEAFWKARVCNVPINRFAGQTSHQDIASRQQGAEIDPGAKSHGFEQKHEILSDDVAGGARRVGASADAALGGIKTSHAAVECRHNIGETLAASVMKVRARALLANLSAYLLKQAPNLNRICIADRIREIHYVGAALRHGHRHPHRIGFRDDALNRTAKRSRQASLDHDFWETEIEQRPQGADDGIDYRLRHGGAAR